MEKMIRIPAIVLTLSCLLLSAIPAAHAAPPRPFNGAGCTFPLPEGMTAREGWTGSVYLVSIRRKGRSDDRALPFMEIVVLPNSDMKPEECGAAVANDLYKILEKEGRTRGARTVIHGKIAGRPVDGVAIAFSLAGKPAETLDLFAMANGDQRVVVATKSAAVPRAEDQAKLRQILDNLSLKTLKKDSLVRAVGGPVAFHVPLLTRVKWKQTASGGIRGQFGLPEGTLQLFALDLGTRVRAGKALEKSASAHQEELEREVKAAGGTIVSNGAVFVPVGDKLVTGVFSRVSLPKGVRRDSVFVPVQDGSVLVGFSFLSDVGKAKAMAARIVQILGSYERKSLDVRPGDRLVRLGLSLPVGVNEDLAWGTDGAIDWIRTFSLLVAPSSSTPFEACGFRLEVRHPPLSWKNSRVSGAEALHVRVFSTRRAVEVSHIPAGKGEPALVSVRVGVPFRDGGLVLRMTGVEGSLPFLEEAFSRRLSGISRTGTEPIELSSGAFKVKFDPTRFWAFTRGPWSSRQLDVVCGRSYAEFTFTPDVGALPDSTLSDHVRARIEKFRRGPGRSMKSAGRIRIDSVTTRGPKLVRASVTFVGKDGKTGRFEAVAGLLRGGSIEGAVRLDDTSTKGLGAALDALVTSLSK